MAYTYALDEYGYLIEALFGAPYFCVAADDKRFPFGELELTTHLLTEHWKATTSASELERLDIPRLSDFIRALAQLLERHLKEAKINPSPGMLITRSMRNFAYTTSHRILSIWLSHQTLCQLEHLCQAAVRPYTAEDYVVERPAYSTYRDSPEEHIEDWPDIVDRDKIWQAVRKEEGFALLREIYSHVSRKMDLGLEPL